MFKFVVSLSGSPFCALECVRYLDFGGFPLVHFAVDVVKS